MKKMFAAVVIILCTAMPMMAQKYALVDMQYILKNVPSYETANEQLSIVSKKWQKEVESKLQEMHKWTIFQMS